MCGCSLHITGLTSLHLGCATLPQLHSLRFPIPIPALLHSRTETFQQVGRLTSYHEEAPLAVLAMHALQGRHLPPFACRVQFCRATQLGLLRRHAGSIDELLQKGLAEYTPRKHRECSRTPHAPAANPSTEFAATANDEVTSLEIGAIPRLLRQVPRSLMHRRLLRSLSRITT
jgi:hypothetical protein